MTRAAGGRRRRGRRRPTECTELVSHGNPPPNSRTGAEPARVQSERICKGEYCHLVFQRRTLAAVRFYFLQWSTLPSSVAMQNHRNNMFIQVYTLLLNCLSYRKKMIKG